MIRLSPSVVLTHNHPDNIVGVSDTLLITATFNEAMTGTPTLSFSGLITDTLMDDSANPAVWTYSIDLSTLSIPNSGDYFVTVVVAIWPEMYTAMPLVLKMGMKLQ